MNHKSVECGKNQMPSRDAVVRNVRSCILIALAISFLTVYLAFIANQSAYACDFNPTLSSTIIVQGGTITVTGDDTCGPPGGETVVFDFYATSSCPASGTPPGTYVGDEMQQLVTGQTTYTSTFQPLTGSGNPLPPGSYCIYAWSSSYPSGSDLPFTVTGAGPPAAAALTVSPSPQAIPQAQTATFDVDLTSGVPNTAYMFSVSGVAGAFTTNPVTTDATGAGNTQLVADATTPPTYCPGTYSFTVTATGGGGTASADGVLTVTQVGPSLQVTVSTDKTSYQKGDTVTVSLTVSRPAEGTVTVTGPSGGPMTYPFTATSAGTETVTTFTAQDIGSYSVSVQADDFCAGTTSGQATFQVTPNTYDATISLSGIPANVSAGLEVDGQSQGTLQGSAPKTLTFPIGSTHTVTVDQYVAGASGVRYYCAQNSWTASGTGNNAFTYQTQYQLSVSVNPAGVTQVSGGGWFNIGNSAQTSQAPQTVPGPTGVQYVFENWVVDGVTQTGNQITVPMNGPHTAVAQYNTQYLLTINSPNGLGNPQGEGYYDAGSTAEFSVTSPVGYLIQQAFVQWQGDFTGTSPQGSITMDGPKTINAVWATSYMNLYIAGGAGAALIVIAAAFGMHRRKQSGPGNRPPTNGRAEPQTTRRSLDAW